MYKTEQDIQLLVEKASIKPLLDFTESYLKGKKVSEFINGSIDKETGEVTSKSLKEQYQELYPDVKIEEYDRFGNTLTREVPIEYIEYSAEKEQYDEETGETELVPDLPELTEEQAELPVRPTFEFFKEKKLAEFIETLEITDGELKEAAKQPFIDIVSRLADRTHEKAEAVIAQVEKISEKQIQRYKLKAVLAQKAKDGDADAKAKLQTEADLVGVDIDTLIELILDLAAQYNTEVDDYISLVEAFRVAVKAKYNTDFRAAVKVAVEAKALGTNNTPETLQELFEKHFK